MRKILALFLYFSFVGFINAQEIGDKRLMKIDTVNLNLAEFAQKITAQETANLGRATSLLKWVNTTLAWMPTDYKQRSVTEILARGGGNCDELATVYMRLIRAINIRYRPVAEINIHALSLEREQTANRKIAEAGNRMSVFGKLHNDHRWCEIYDSVTDTWVPVDPTMNVIGTEQWLKARVCFGKRISVDTNSTNAMIVPFAIFVTGTTRKNMIECRSNHYLVKEFDKLYEYKLSKLPSWNAWVAGLDFIQDHAKMAFEGKENLHNFNRQIEELASTYQQLKREYEMFVKSAK